MSSSDHQEDPYPIDKSTLDRTLQLLSEYRNPYIQETMKSQDPAVIGRIRGVLAKKGNTIIQFFNRPADYVRDPSDTQLNALIEELASTSGDNPRFRIIVADYVNKLFIHFPFTLNHTHIDSLAGSQASPDNSPHHD
jgi:hypothetical protein